MMGTNSSSQVYSGWSVFFLIACLFFPGEAANGKDFPGNDIKKKSDLVLIKQSGRSDAGIKEKELKTDSPVVEELGALPLEKLLESSEESLPASQEEAEVKLGDDAVTQDSEVGRSITGVRAMQPVLEASDPKAIYVIPIQEAIGKPTLYIVRRGLKEAIENEIDVVFLDMHTPGGESDVMLEVMEILDRFEGETLTFVNVDAFSAGAFIAASTDHIYFAPKSQIGAAAPIFATGQEVPDTLRQKFESAIMAKVRNYNETDPYRAKVIRAMMSADYVLEIEGEVIKPEGELLSLTASEALAEYGDPPRALLGAGIKETLEEVLEDRFGVGNFKIKEFEITWSETLAQYMAMVSPLLMGIGFLCLLVEFKTPGFGIFGGVGVILLLIVFASNYVAGLAGHEAVLFFLLGIVLIGVELFLIPGTVFPALAGILLVFGSLVWSLADIWPTGGGRSFELDLKVLWQPVYELLLSLLVTVTAGFVLWRFLPRTWIFDSIVLSGQVAAADPVTAGGGSSLRGRGTLPEIGAAGIAATDLHPAGEVEIEGTRYQATLGVGTLNRGNSVKVVGHRSFALLVEKVD